MESPSSNTSPAESQQKVDRPQEKSLEGEPTEGTPAVDFSPSDFPEGGLRAWLVAYGAAAVMFCTFGYGNAFGVFQDYYQTHQLHDKTPSDISWIGSLQIFFLFGGTLIGGPLFDQFGAKIIWPAAFVYVFSVMMTSISKSYYQFLLAQGILGGFTMGMCMAPGMAATGQYFRKKRGAAMGLAVAGSSLGGVIFPIALSRMLYNPRLGFGWAVRICGFIMLALLSVGCAGIRARLPPRKGNFFLPSAFKQLQYTTLLGALFLVLLGVFIPIFYLPTYAVEHGMGVQLASYLVSILNGSSFFGRLIPGILADKVGRLNMLCAAAVSTGILILCWQKITSNAAIIVFSVLYGFCSGAIVSMMSVCIAQVPKDAREIGTYLGMGMAVISVAALVGPPINGALLSHYGSYEQVAIFSGVVVLTGGLLILVTKHLTGKGVISKT